MIKYDMLLWRKLAKKWYTVTNPIALFSAKGVIRMVCRRCGSSNVNVQAVSVVKNKHHGVFYWLFFGWLIDLLLWIFLAIPRLLVALFGGKRVKTTVHSEAVCQNCGYRWKA